MHTICTINCEHNKTLPYFLDVVGGTSLWDGHVNQWASDIVKLFNTRQGAPVSLGLARRSPTAGTEAAAGFSGGASVP